MPVYGVFLFLTPVITQKMYMTKIYIKIIHTSFCLQLFTQLTYLTPKSDNNEGQLTTTRHYKS